jgi:hypothetical protein
MKMAVIFDIEIVAEVAVKIGKPFMLTVEGAACLSI